MLTVPGFICSFDAQAVHCCMLGHPIYVMHFLVSLPEVQALYITLLQRVASAAVAVHVELALLPFAGVLWFALVCTCVLCILHDMCYMVDWRIATAKNTGTRTRLVPACSGSLSSAFPFLFCLLGMCGTTCSGGACENMLACLRFCWIMSCALHCTGLS